jgi:tol-pal system-associated acyl-CoA thioesterase
VSVFCSPQRVYWEDTDAGGVVYYANYLKFLERARTEWLRAQGFSQHELVQRPGVLFAVTSVEVSYQRPARLDDQLLVTCELERAGAASLRFAQRIYRRAAEDELLTTARVRVACLDARTLRPQRLPDFLQDILMQHEERA